eukprot:1449899-Amphidinium_carterae.1
MEVLKALFQHPCGYGSPPGWAEVNFGPVALYVVERCSHTESPPRQDLPVPKLHNPKGARHENANFNDVSAQCLFLFNNVCRDIVPLWG